MNKYESSNIRYLKGVGPQKEIAFNKLNIFSIADLFEYYPRDYQDRTIITPIKDLESDLYFCVEGVVTTIELIRIRSKLTILKLLISDGIGVMYCTWFNQEYLKSKFKENNKYLFYGRATKNRGVFELNSPDFSTNKENFLKIVPIYKKNSLLTQNFLRSCVHDAIINHKENFIDIFSDLMREKYDLLEKNKAVENIHFPDSNELFFKARRRLVFEELFILQLVLLKIREGIKNKDSSFSYQNDELFSLLEKKLPYELTNAQLRVIKEITEDLFSKRIMNRMIQGDVGSGKTIVALAAVIKTYENGYQSAFMAPTEILAKQHYNNIKELVSFIPMNIAFISGSLPAKEKRAVVDGIKNGEYDLIIGTHAIIQESIEFKNLALAITDEQHRFGVKQRELLSKKGDEPNVLVMTATPIPRTLALILYGDLDYSLIDEMPKGRQGIETFVVNESKRSRINSFIKKRMKNHEQVFIVCPTIEESEKLHLKNVTEVYKESVRVFSEYRVSMIHGKLKAKDKNSIMEKFKNGEIDILVSTTVIEVGVDIKNATLMVIENADRFGIAQLHQLRGRVGRGNKKSYCILFNESNSPKSIERLKVLEKSNDGYYLSEQDLILRGPGEFFGTKQHGIPELKIANLYNDALLLKEAQKAALDIIHTDYDFNKKENQLIKKEIEEKLKNIIIE